jgi:hypothetical protein
MVDKFKIVLSLMSYFSTLAEYILRYSPFLFVLAPCYLA